MGPLSDLRLTHAWPHACCPLPSIQMTVGVRKCEKVLLVLNNSYKANLGVAVLRKLMTPPADQKADWVSPIRPEMSERVEKAEQHKAKSIPFDFMAAYQMRRIW